ncbi:lipoate--protein ligase family protein [Pseudorhodoplanes sp.]|uniref:lipoate--protein ligase family protein n=1 Tax=Pseudorhodoplanes sp. TaxID=1934341 RepID=UPI003D134C1B
MHTGERAARWNVAATAALTELHGAGRIADTLRFHRYRESVLIGRHQSLGRAVHVGRCAQNGIELARRVTGGGAVYMAPGALAWDIVIDRKAWRMGAADANDAIGKAVASGLARLGLAARYRAEGEIEVGGRKVCGMSGYRNGDTLVCQGTILVDTDLGDMAHYLRLPAKDLREARRSLQDRVATIGEFLGHRPREGELEAAIACSLAQSLNCEMSDEAFSAEEQRLADRWHRDEIGTDAFVFDDRPLDAAAPMAVGRDGNIEALITLHAGSDRRIDQIWLTGPFSATPSRTMRDLEAALRGLPVASAAQKATEFLVSHPVELRGASRVSVAAAIAKAQT